MDQEINPQPTNQIPQDVSTNLPKNRNHLKKVVIFSAVIVLAALTGAITYALISNADQETPVQNQTESNESTELNDAKAKVRDVQRITDINNLHSKLEEYFNENGAYPQSFNADTFFGIDPEALIDPSGNSIVIHKPVADEAAAAAVLLQQGADYLYVPYPSACSANTCTGYVLRTYIELPSGSVPNPYTKLGLNNN